jgi:hypothetical protein
MDDVPSSDPGSQRFRDRGASERSDVPQRTIRREGERDQPKGAAAVCRNRRAEIEDPKSRLCQRNRFQGTAQARAVAIRTETTPMSARQTDPGLDGARLLTCLHFGLADYDHNFRRGKRIGSSAISRQRENVSGTALVSNKGWIATEIFIDFVRIETLGDFP